MRLPDFMRIEESATRYVLVYDNNHDGTPDTWIVWEREPLLREVEWRSDKNFDGKVDQWYYVGSTGLVQEIDTDFDGEVDKRRYAEHEYTQQGRISTDDTGDHDE